MTTNVEMHVKDTKEEDYTSNSLNKAEERPLGRGQIWEENMKKVKGKHMEKDLNREAKKITEWENPEFITLFHIYN